MNSFIYGKERSNDIFSSVVTREYSYTVKEKNVEKIVPEFYVESKFKERKVSIDFLALITLEELNSFEIDEEVYFNDYVIGNELFIGFDTDYKNIDINDIDIFITKVDNDYFNLRIEISKYEIIIDNNFKIDEKNEKVQMDEPLE